MTQQELDALKALAARDESAVPLCSEYRQGIVALIAEVERLGDAWSVEHDAYIRADEQARMAKRDADELRGEVRELQNRLSAADPDIVWID